MKKTMKKMIIALGIIGMATTGFSAAKKPAPKKTSTAVKQCKDKNGKIIKCPSTATKKVTTQKKTNTEPKKTPSSPAKSPKK